MKNRHKKQIKVLVQKPEETLKACDQNSNNASRGYASGRGIIILTFLCLFTATLSFAQQGEFSKWSLQRETPLRHKIFVDKFENKGSNNDVDFGQVVKDYLSEPKDTYLSKDTKIFVPAQNKQEADVVVSGEYVYNNNSEVIEKSFLERSTSYASRVPYFEIRVKNSADLNLVFHFNYKDGTSATDTLIHEEFSETSDKGELKSQVVLEENTLKEVRNRLFTYTDITDYDRYWVKMPKIKIKDKELKSQYKEMSKYLKEGKVKELGAFYLKLYEEKQSQELAQCIGICYDLIGNYEKAEQYYEGLNDFATNIRMKDQLELDNYIRELGVTISVEDF
ncbi:MAG: hypothetical protein ACOC2E_09650 [Bacteroidota bacterium]